MRPSPSSSWSDVAAVAAGHRGLEHLLDADDVGAAGGEEAGRVGVVRDAVGEQPLDRRPGVGDAHEPDAAVAVRREDGAEV